MYGQQNVKFSKQFCDQDVAHIKTGKTIVFGSVQGILILTDIL
jgi:hypothetical protein